MSVRRGVGQEFARLEGEEKNENIHNSNPGRAGDKRFGTRIQGADRAAKTGASDGHAAATFRTARG
jgi:hypothetical protein